jgi:hypothetical protein
MTPIIYCLLTSGRQLGQPIKLLLAYAGVEYEDKVYELDWDAWVAEKYSLGLVFPNVIITYMSLYALLLRVEILVTLFRLFFFFLAIRL